MPGHVVFGYVHLFARFDLPVDARTRLTFVGITQRIRSDEPTDERFFIHVSIDLIKTEYAPTGLFTWPFSFTLPPSLPESHLYASRDHSCRVLYELRAQVSSKLMAEKRCSLFPEEVLLSAQERVTVLRQTVNLPQVLAQERKQKIKAPDYYMSKGGTCQMSSLLNRSHVQPGDTLELSVKLDMSGTKRALK